MLCHLKNVSNHQNMKKVTKCLVFSNRGTKVVQNKIGDQNCAKQNKGTKIVHFIKYMENKIAFKLNMFLTKS
jgi:hypothetical protein